MLNELVFVFHLIEGLSFQDDRASFGSDRIVKDIVSDENATNGLVLE